MIGYNGTDATTTAKAYKAWVGMDQSLREFKVPIVAIQKGVCLQNTSKPHSYHLKIWRLL